MSGGWIPQGADTKAPGAAPDADNEAWQTTAPDTPGIGALARPGHDPNAHPVDHTRGLLTKTSDLLFGHEPKDANEPDQAHEPGILASPWRDWTTPTPLEPGSPMALAKAGELTAQPQTADTKAEIERLSRTEQGGPKLATLGTALAHLYGADVQAVKAFIARECA